MTGGEWLVGSVMLLYLGLCSTITVRRASAEVRERFKLPLRQALAPPPGTPQRLEPGGDWEHRSRLIGIAYCVTMAKARPWLYGLGIACAMVWMYLYKFS